MQFPSRFLIFLHSLDKPQLEEKQKTLQSLPVRSVTILISQKVPDPACVFFHVFVKQDTGPKQHVLGTQTIQEISETGKTEAKIRDSKVPTTHGEENKT